MSMHGGIGGGQLRNALAESEQKNGELGHKLRLREKELLDLQVHTARALSLVAVGIHELGYNSVGWCRNKGHPSSVQ